MATTHFLPKGLKIIVLKLKEFTGGLRLLSSIMGLHWTIMEKPRMMRFLDVWKYSGWKVFKKLCLIGWGYRYLWKGLFFF